MTITRVLTTTSALALCAGPALADLSAQEVWSDWKDLLDSYGAEISTASESQSGGTLTVSGLTASFSVQDGSFALNLGDVTFTEQGDGSVAISMAESLPFDMDIATPEGETATVGFTLNQPGAKMVASGDAANMRYDFDYPTMSFTDFTIAGDDIPDNLPFTFDMAASGLTGFMALSDGDVRAYTSDSEMDSFTLDMVFDDPKEGAGSLKMELTDVTQSVAGALADIELDMSMAELVQAGLSQTGTGSYGPSTYSMNFDGPDGAFEMAAAAEGGTLDFSIDGNGLNYGGVSNGITLTVGGSQIPFPPMTFTMSQSEGRLQMPSVPNAENAQDFGLLFSMIGLTIDDMLWGMFDPTEQIPRDPANIVIDLAGKAIITEDFTSPEYAESMNAAPPGTLEEVTINSVQLSLAGAELTGDGAFAFNNDFDIPMPSGTANLMLSGGNTLLDTLVGMGLVPEDQAMGARMMLGLFARPGDGPDTLVSTIEVNEDGSILANGQRIK